MAIVFVYMVLFDGGRRGATPGKRVVGIGVIDADSGQPIGYRRAVIRRAVYIIGGLCVYLDWLWILVDRRRQAWHDKAAETIVVRTR